MQRHPRIPRRPAAARSSRSGASLVMALTVALAGALAGGAVLLACQGTPAPSPQTGPNARGNHPEIESIDTPLAGEKVLGAPRRSTAALTPVALRVGSREAGWAVRLPGALPLATPAIMDGLLFIGGGYGSHEFYALDIQTGELRWKFKTGDDGPTAAVADDGFVAFNTESCTVYVLDAKTGRFIWSRYLGDPLMSQPAIADGVLYMVYPGRSPKPVQYPGGRTYTEPDGIPMPMPGKAPDAGLPGSELDTSGTETTDNTPAASPQTAPSGMHVMTAMSHTLIAMDLRTGHALWQQPVAGDAIQAPIVDGGNVYVTTFSGTVACFDAKTGLCRWCCQQQATSAPTIADGRLYYSQQRDGDEYKVNGRRTRQKLEGMVAQDATRPREQAWKNKKQRADYLNAVERQTSKQHAADKSLDLGVGFGSKPETAQLDKAAGNTGMQSVASGWGYQGSRVTVVGNRAFNAQGAVLSCVDATTGEAHWARKFELAHEDGDRVAALTPPVVVNGRVYLAAISGDVFCVDANDGTVIWALDIGHPVRFPPSLSGGRVFVATADGHVFALDANDPAADGWTMWGGNAQHNAATN